MFRKLLLSSLLAAALAFSAGSRAQGIRIAVVGPMAYVQGENHWAGAEMARDEINQAGGIAVGGARRPIELLRVDTNEIQSVADATFAAETVISRDKADFLVGGFRSEAVLAMQEIAMNHRKLFLGVGSAHGKLGQNVQARYERYKYWFMVYPTKSADLGRTLFAVLDSIADQVRRERKKETPRVAIFAERAAWTEPIIKAVQENLPKLRMEAAGVWQTTERSTDVSGELEAIKRAGADIVFTLVSGPLGGTLGRQMGEQNSPAAAFGINVEAQKDSFWNATGGKAGHVAMPDTYADVEITPKTIAFLKEFRARYKRSPGYTAATYDAVMILKSAIEQAGSTDADKLVAVIEKMEHVGSAATASWDKNHDLIWAEGKTAGIAVQWQDGQKVPFWPPQVKGMKPFRLPVP